MSKTFTKILISVILVGIFAMPISSIVRLENEKLTIGIEINKARAQQENEPIWGFKVVKTTFNPNPNIQSITTIILETHSGLTKGACDTVHTTAENNPAYDGDGITIESCTANPKDLTSSTFSNVYSNDGKKLQPSSDFGCGILDLDNCFIQLLYWVGFRLTSFFAYLSARFLDYFMYYSISDEAYRNEFMGKAWGAVRDIANIFFIIALLYVAIKTILNMGVSSSKKMVGTIIVIALLINFSLFVTQVVIDASNILANIFYHQITAKDENGKLKESSGGEKSVTVQLTSIFDPQKILSGTPVEDHEGTWLIVVSLATIISIFMIIIFLSTAFLFVGRIVELWMAMIFSPIAFASKTIGGKITFFGWDEWLSAMLKSAFLAPIFIFFLYIIILLGELISTVTLGGAGTPGEDTGQNVDWAMKTIVPFAIIFFMLFIAKKVAKDYSGRVGKAVAGATTALTGIALGGAAMGTALLGRNTLGAVTKFTQNDSARQKTLSGQGFKDIKGLNKINPFAYVKEAGKFASASLAQGLHSIPSTKKDASGKRLTLGKAMQESEKDFGKKKSSAHSLDSAAQSKFGGKGKYDKDVKFSDLTESEQLDVKKNIDKDKLAQARFGVNFENIKDDINKAAVKTEVETIYEKYEKTDRSSVEKEATAKETLSSSLGALNVKEDANKLVSQAGANKAMGEFVSALRRGTYDMRNLSQTKVASKGFGKLAVGIIGAVALGMRTGIKKGIGADHGTGKGKFGEDMKTILAGALAGLKDLNIDIAPPKSGGHGGGDHGHGGGDKGHH